MRVVTTMVTDHAPSGQRVEIKEVVRKTFLPFILWSKSKTENDTKGELRNKDAL